MDDGPVLDAQTVRDLMSKPWISATSDSEDSVDAESNVFDNSHKSIALQLDNEKWTVDRETAEFLASISKEPEHEENLDDILDALTKPTFESLKMEEPLLPTDHAQDVAALKQRTAINFPTRGMKPFKIDQESGEELAWRTAASVLPAQMSARLANEKFEVDQATARYLHEILEPEVYSDDEMMELLCDRDEVRRLHFKEAQTLTC
jgi:hypothetical protein